MTSIKHFLILDNGAHSIKAGFCDDLVPKIIPNCVTKVKSERRRPFIGDQQSEMKDYSGMYYILPFTKGYLINWDVQRQVWDYLFRTKLKLPTDSKNRFSQIAIIITEPVYNFQPIRENMIELLFEEYGFGEILICSAPQLAAFQYCHQMNKKGASQTSKELACLVVDSGFSFTHITPIVEGHKLLSHTKRIDIGGKALTNHLKDIISYRKLNVLDETYVVNQMKEDCCFVSTDFWKDLEIASQRNNTISLDYILPDYNNVKRGFVDDNEKHRELLDSLKADGNEPQRIRMNNERFQVPELLFNPGDVGIDQIGISHSIIHSVGEFQPNFNSGENGTFDTSTPNFMPEKVTTKPSLKEIDTDEDEEEEESDLDDSNEQVSPPDNSTRNGVKAGAVNGKEDGTERSQEMDVFAMFQDENVQSHLYNNIILIGGNCAFPNFADRVSNDIRSNVADLLNTRVTLPEDPATYAWKGGRTLCTVDDKGDPVGRESQCLFHKFSVTKQEYSELGLGHCSTKLANYQLPTFSNKS